MTNPKRTRMPKLCRQRGHGKRGDRAYVTIDGTRHYLGTHGDGATRKLYNRLCSHWERTGCVPLDLLCESSAPVPNEITVAEIGRQFRQYADGYYVNPDGSPSKEHTSFRTAWRIVREMFGSVRAVDFGPKKLREVQYAMSRKRKPNGQTWCRKHVNGQTRRVRQIFNWAVAEELIPVTVAQALHRVRGLRVNENGVRENKKKLPVPQDEIDAIEPFVSAQVWAIIQLQLLTGARSGELVGLRPVDLTDTSGDIWLVEVTEHKTVHHGKTRTLYFGPKAQRVLEPFLAERPIGCPLFSPTEAETERRRILHAARKTPLSCGNRPGSNRKKDPRRRPGDAYTSGSYYRRIKRACLRAHPYPADIHLSGKRWRALTPEQQEEQREQQRLWKERYCWNPHRLRHNFGTMIRRQFGAEKAQNMLDHSSIDVTLIYAERSREEAIEIARAVG